MLSVCMFSGHVLLAPNIFVESKTVYLVMWLQLYTVYFVHSSQLRGSINLQSVILLFIVRGYNNEHHQFTGCYINILLIPVVV